MSARYADIEAFLVEVIPPDIAARVLARVETQPELDRSFEWCAVSTLLRGLTKQIEDVAGYSAILAARCDSAGPTTGPRARALLAAIAQRGAEAHALAAALEKMLGRPS